MKRIVWSVFATLSAIVLLFSYRTSLDVVPPTAAADPAPTKTATTTPDASAAAPPASSTAATPSPSASASASASSAAPSPSTSTSASASGLTDGTFTGSAVDTRYGAVQVAVTIAGGRITAVQVPEYPNTERRDQEINAQALPVLVSETTSAQSADIQMVSGATYTSAGYRQSLQSALDQAAGR